jgi:hypothetical protein
LGLKTLLLLASRGSQMKTFVLVAAGWLCFVLGVLLMPVPLPLPFPVGPILVLLGCAILTPRSKSFRRGVQRVRHRFGWLSRGMDRCATRAPASVKSMMAQTSPRPLERHARLRDFRSNP